MFQHGRPPKAHSSWPTLGHLILAAGTAIALIAAPISLEPDTMVVTWQAAHGKNSDGGGGNGKGAGHGSSGHARGKSDRDVGHQDQSHGRRGQGGGPGHGKDYQGLDEFVDDVRSGKAFGRGRHDERFEHAKERYDHARGHANHGGAGSEHGDVQVAHRFSADETRHLIARGWRARQAADDSFKNHGQRVRTMVELAKRLGYDPRVGAMQANFGTSHENGIAKIEAALAEARADVAAAGDDPEAAARVAELEADLEEAVAAAKPGNGANHDWARADLDVNHDGVIDPRDLEALDAQVGDQERSHVRSTEPDAS